MGEQLTALAGVAIVFGVTFLLMRAMWRQMRRVNSHTAEISRRRAEENSAPPVEAWDAERGQYVPVAGDCNEELLRHGERARSSGWYLEP